MPGCTVGKLNSGVGQSFGLLVVALQYVVLVWIHYQSLYKLF